MRKEACYTAVTEGSHAYHSASPQASCSFGDKRFSSIFGDRGVSSPALPLRIIGGVLQVQCIAQ